MRLLMDADILVYRAAVVTENDFDWGDDLHTLHSDAKQAKQIIERQLDRICKDLDQPRSAVTMCFTDRENWRKRENPDYKSNRNNVRKPLAFKSLVQWCHDEFAALSMPGLEADDVMGIVATENPDSTIIVSADKDLGSVPCTLFNPDKDTRPRLITEGEADLMFYCQAVAGDSTDGYPGCPGIGMKTAKKTLDHFLYDHGFDCEAAWCWITERYEKKELTVEDAVMNARMARICRAGDWDFQNGEMTWEPPTDPNPST